ncbi:MAG: hypothetical protein AB7U35_03485 [Sphingobium sp.]
MRFTPATLAMAAVLTMVSSVGIGQKPDSDINPRSLAWQEKGDAARAAGSLQAATDAYESALAIDPRNRGAFVALGDVAREQGLQGKALRYYNGALALEPNDTAALGGVIHAMADKGALTTARETLARLRAICRSDCQQTADLGALLDRKATAQAAMSPKDVAAAAADSKALAQQQP